MSIRQATMLSKRASAAKNSKSSFKDMVDLCMVSAVVGVAIYCSYKVAMDYNDLRYPSARKPETKKQN